MDLPFLLLAAITVAGAVASITLPNLVHCALGAACSFTGLAGLYLKLNAQFLGFAQFLVYVGAIAILILFVVLLTRGPFERHRFSQGSLWGLGIAVAFCALLCGAVISSGMLPRAHTPPPVTVRALGDLLMTRYVLALEVVGLLLTAALLGGVLLALPERDTRAQLQHKSQEQGSTL